jgi:hypothetical protein
LPALRQPPALVLLLLLMVLLLLLLLLLCTWSTVQAPILSVVVRPDGLGMASGGADKNIKFWDFDLRTVDTGAAAGAGGAAAGVKQLTLVHSRTLAMTDEVQCLAYSHHHEANKLLVAAGLLDSTVKVRGGVAGDGVRDRLLRGLQRCRAFCLSVVGVLRGGGYRVVRL